MLAMFSPMMVVSVEGDEGQVYKVTSPAGSVPMFFAVNVLKAFAMRYPSAIAKAKALGSLSVKPCALPDAS